MLKTTTAIVVAVLAMPGLAMAEDATNAPMTSTTATAPAVASSSAWYVGKLGEEIIGKDLYTEDGTEIGEIDNIIIGTDGKQPAALLGVGGFLGLGERDVAISLDDIAMGAEDRLTTSMTKEEIGALQPYSTDGVWKMYDHTRPLGQ